jgi:spore coat polysaccharide biosynthesis protein SpsF
MGKQINGAIIQVRICSSRLPAKVLLKLPFDSEYTILDQIIKRAKKSIKLGQIILATSHSETDDAIEDYANKINIECFRGPEDNVLERFYLCAQQYEIKHIVRLCGDSPFIDSKLIDKYLTLHLEHENDYTGTRDYPLGTNTEIFTFSALEKAYQNAKEKNEQEHVTPFIRNNASLFKIEYCEASGKYKKPSIRLTVDTKEDYAVACAIYDNLDRGALFSLSDTIELLEKKPWIASINVNIIQKKVFTSLDEELNELNQIAIIQDLRRAAEFLKSVRNT